MKMLNRSIARHCRSGFQTRHPGWIGYRFDPFGRKPHVFRSCTIDDELDELLLPYTIDLSIFGQLTHVELLEHIEQVGIVFCELERTKN